MFDSIKSSPLFHELYEDEIESLLGDCRVVSFDPDELVIKEGENGNELFIVLNGEVSIEKDGVEHPFAVLGSGEVFGEMVLINENTRTTNGRSTKASEVLILPSDKIFGLFEASPRTFSILMFNLSRLLVKRLRQADERMSKNP